MKLAKTFLFAAALTAALSFTVAAAAADRTPAAELERVMRFEPALAEADVRLYLANLPAIFALRQQPGQAQAVASSIQGWTENRFAYVTTKMAVGLNTLLKPEDPRNAAAPAFAKPTAAELALIKSHQDELVKGLEALGGAPAK